MMSIWKVCVQASRRTVQQLYIYYLNTAKASTHRRHNKQIDDTTTQQSSNIANNNQNLQILI